VKIELENEKLKMKKKLIYILLFITFTGQPAMACLSCGCESSGSSADLGAIGAASGIFSKGKKFILQVGSGLRIVNGSFNEQGHWFPTPVNSSLLSMQNTLGLMYFPLPEISLGLQFPLVSNFLSGAAWGAFGSIAPTELGGTSSGTAVGDLSFQGTYKFYENNEFNFASAVWARASLPTGQMNGKPEFLTGSGITSLTGGIFALKKYGSLELLVNAGYQQPLSRPAESSFSVGNAFLYQLQANYQFTPEFKGGLGINGLLGNWLLAVNNKSMSTSKLKLTANAQYDLTLFNGLGLSIGYDLSGANAITDTTLNLVFYQYF
jgi:hypothetical protein